MLRRTGARTSKGANWVALAIGLTIIWAAFEATAWAFTREARSTASWPHVQGVVKASQIKEERHQTKSGGMYLVRKPSIRYEYTVGDAVLEGDRYCVAPEGLTQEQAESAVRTHPAGSSTTVYYDPQDPKKSVLEVGLGRVAGIVWTVRIALGLAAGSCWLRAGIARPAAAFGGLAPGPRPGRRLDPGP